MSDCCDARADSTNQRSACPTCRQLHAHLAKSTMLHHLANPWENALVSQRYFFCDDPQCPVIYYGDAGDVFKQADLRTQVGLKSPTPESALCYCFGVTYAQAVADPAIRAFVIKETKNKSCACDTRNPAGMCCLKTFPRTA